jgi:hypothetical protein
LTILSVTACATLAKREQARHPDATQDDLLALIHAAGADPERAHRGLQLAADRGWINLPATKPEAPTLAVHGGPDGQHSATGDRGGSQPRSDSSADRRVAQLIESARAAGGGGGLR